MEENAAQSAEMVALHRARNALRTDAARVAETLNELVASDERFMTHSKSSTETYDEKLRAANRRVEAIARRETLDNRILWWSFTFFFAVVAFIWSKRLLGFSLW